MLQVFYLYLINTINYEYDKYFLIESFNRNKIYKKLSFLLFRMILKSKISIFETLSN